MVPSAPCTPQRLIDLQTRICGLTAPACRARNDALPRQNLQVTLCEHLTFATLSSFPSSVRTVPKDWRIPIFLTFSSFRFSISRTARQMSHTKLSAGSNKSFQVNGVFSGFGRIRF